MNASRLVDGPVCATPIRDDERVQLGHGSGGKMSARLLRDRFLPRFGNAALDRLGDGAVLAVGAGEIVVSTDTFVVSPLEFPGGDIGALAVHGTLNDLAMMGAEPRWLTAGFVLEEGLPLAVLDRILDTMARAAKRSGVDIVTGDTKVVDRGKADGMFINTTGIGTIVDGFRPAPDRVGPGDAVLVSGPVGRHGMAIMAAREGLGLVSTIESDTACLAPLVSRLRNELGSAVHALRDPTRGGLASTLNEIASASDVGIVLEDGALPVPANVTAACEILGLDPLYVANEGIFAAFVRADAADHALEVLRAHPLGASAVRIGSVTPNHRGLVVLRTGLGGSRVVDQLPGAQLPRIC